MRRRGKRRGVGGDVVGSEGELIGGKALIFAAVLLVGEHGWPIDGCG